MTSLTKFPHHKVGKAALMEIATVVVENSDKSGFRKLICFNV